jgi:predicted extracellular nuclease
VVNHLKSKGSDCNAMGDPDTGDGQGNCNGTRTGAAEALVDWLATDPTGSGDPDVLVIGDMNAYAKEEPIAVLEGAGDTNTIADSIGAEAYSFVFQGQSGYLDHAIASPSLSGQVAGVTEWHINADEPIALDYNTEFKTPPPGHPSVPVNCTSREPIGAEEPTVTPGGGITYVASTDTYLYEWKTSKGWNDCRRLIVTPADGTRHHADFQFK